MNTEQYVAATKDLTRREYEADFLGLWQKYERLRLGVCARLQVPTTFQLPPHP